MISEEQRVFEKLQLLNLGATRRFGLVVKHKEDVLAWRVRAAVVYVLTFGKVKLLETSWTTIGTTVYVPRRYDKDQKKTYRYGDLPFHDYVGLSHELVHVVDCSKAGIALFLLGYVFVFFPIGFAYVRYRLERKAYLTGLIAAKRIGYEKYIKQHYKGPHEPLLDRAVRNCSTAPMYLWMWPFPKSVRRWFETQLALEDKQSRSVLQASIDA